MLHVTAVEWVEAYVLRLRFNDGSEKEVDLEGELWGDVFEPLKDLEVFRQVVVNPETDTIEWPTGADFAPEFLHEKGREVQERRYRTSDVSPRTRA